MLEEKRIYAAIARSIFIIVCILRDAIGGYFSNLLGFYPAEGDDLEFATEVDAVVLLGGVEVG